MAKSLKPTSKESILAFGPEEVLSMLTKEYSRNINDKSVSLKTAEPDISAVKYVQTMFLLHTCTAFILTFYTDDEDSFQAVSAFKDKILNAKKDQAVPLVVVGCNRCTSAPRIMCPITADCVVSVDWELSYTEVKVGNAEELENIFQKLFNVILKERDKEEP